MERCACVNNGEHHKQMHPLPAICRGRRGGGEHPVPVDGIDKAKLIALRDAPIAMCDIAYGRFEGQTKRDME